MSRAFGWGWYGYDFANAAYEVVVPQDVFEKAELMCSWPFEDVLENLPPFLTPALDHLIKGMDIKRYFSGQSKISAFVSAAEEALVAAAMRQKWDEWLNREGPSLHSYQIYHDVLSPAMEALQATLDPLSLDVPVLSELRWK